MPIFTSATSEISKEGLQNKTELLLKDGPLEKDKLNPIFGNSFCTELATIFLK